MTATMNGLRALTDPEREAVTLHMQKTPIWSITERTGLSAAQIAAAVDQAGALTRASVAAPAPAIIAPTAAPLPDLLPQPVPVASRQPGSEASRARLTTSALLDWADE